MIINNLLAYGLIIFSIWNLRKLKGNNEKLMQFIYTAMITLSIVYITFYELGKFSYRLMN